MKTISYFEGLEIGTVSVKWVRRAADKTLEYRIIRHEGDPIAKIKQLCEENRIDRPSRIFITGQATKQLLQLPYISEVECLEKALSHLGLNPDLLISLGGETFSIYPLINGKIKTIISSSKCAAGTGEFIVQQFQRMGMTIEEGIEASTKGELVEMATRCSVHCKSDATHKLNRGECKRADIARSLIFDLARKVKEMIELSHWPKDSIVIFGGVSQNKVFINILKQLLTQSNIIIPFESPYLEVFGASLHASAVLNEEDSLPEEQWFQDSIPEFQSHLPLKNAEEQLDYRVKPNINGVEGGNTYILGVDAGSTTTKAVLYDTITDKVGASVYLRTLGNPIDALKKCIIKLISQLGKKSIRIIQCGSTGSAREMVSVYLNNCRNFNEILAHARAAKEEHPDVETVFEIGGQDSKYISFLQGIPIDYAMNEGCSAGTGSFLEEFASIDMGIDVNDISKIAQKSSQPIAFGERCAAFINTDVRNALQQGASQEDVIAGLIYSIADNYISRIVGPRNLGKVILFLGGVALNKSVALALAARSKRNIIVPVHPELMGAIGTTLMLKDRITSHEISELDIKLDDLLKGEIVKKGFFTCNACDNKCNIQRIDIRGKTYPFGGFCSKYSLERESGKNTIEGKNYIDLRNHFFFEEWCPKPPKNPRGIIGIPNILSNFDLFPLYAYFFNELEYNIVLSNPTKNRKTKTAASICYPCELAHSAVYELMGQPVDYIFLPHVLELENSLGASLCFACPSTNIIPNIISAAFPDIRNKLLSPHLSLKNEYLSTTLKGIENTAIQLGLSKKKAHNAATNAFNKFSQFKAQYLELGHKIIKETLDEPSIILAGRPYIIYPLEVNLAIPRKIVSRGYNVIPYDLLPPISNNLGYKSNVWAYTQQIFNSLAYAKNKPNMHICFISCFSCGPDSIAYHYFRDKLKGEVFCYLEIDSHTAHAGFDTRIGAFLDIIEERKIGGVLK